MIVFHADITILNKLRSQDSATKQDVWYKTKIRDCSFVKKAQTDISGNTVSNGSLYVVRIPNQANYLRYPEWADNPDGYFTINGGDYIIKGDVEENPTAKNIVEIYNKYRENACKVTYVRDNTEIKSGLAHYHVEGV